MYIPHSQMRYQSCDKRLIIYHNFEMKNNRFAWSSRHLYWRPEDQQSTPLYRSNLQMYAGNLHAILDLFTGMTTIIK